MTQRIKKGLFKVLPASVVALMVLSLVIVGWQGQKVEIALAAAPAGSMSATTLLIRGTQTKAINTITVTDSGAEVTLANDIRILIPATFGAQTAWDSTDTAAAIVNPVTGVVSGTVSYATTNTLDDTLILDVTTSFAAGESVTISGLSIITTGEATTSGVLLWSVDGGAAYSGTSSAALEVDATAPTAPTAVAVTPVGGTVVANTLNTTNTHMTATATIIAGEATGGSAELYVAGVLKLTDATILVGDTTADFTTSDGTPTNGELQAAIAAGGVVTVNLIDAAGNSTASVVGNPTLTVDYVVPTTPVINMVATDDVINAAERTATVTVTGTNESGSTVTLNGNATTIDTATTWSYVLDAATINAFGQGAETLTAVATDANGNPSANGTRAISVDTVVPATPTIDMVATDDVINAAERTATVTVTGGNEAGSTVTLNGNATTIDTATTWSYILDAATINAFGQGAETLTAVATDTAGNPSANGTRAISVDTVVPTTPTIDMVATDDVINAAERTATVTVTGTNESGAAVTLNGNAATADTATTWSYVLDAATINAFGQGAETLTAVATDTAGNPSANGTRAISVDTVLPTVIITDDEAGVANIANGDVQYTFTFSEPVSGFDDTDVIVVNGMNGLFFVDSTTIYRINVTPSAFEGNMTLNVAGGAGVDAAGNPTVIATQADQTVDTLAPTFASVALGADEYVNAADAAAGVNIVISTTGVENGQTVSCTVTDTGAGSVGPVTGLTLGNAVTIASTALTSLADVVLTATCNVSDAAGNPAVAGTDTATKDVAAPSTTDTPTAIDAQPDTYINDAEETAGFDVVVVLGTSGALVGDTVELLLGSAPFGAPLTHVLTAPEAASFYTFNVVSGQLGLDGGKSITAVVTDVAGNVGTESGTLSINLDTASPTPVFSGATDDFGTVMGALISGDTTDDSALLLSGTNESGSTVEVFDGLVSLGAALVVGTNWTFTATVADGVTYQFNANETDAAGNDSIAPTADFTVIGDMTAPAFNDVHAVINQGINAGNDPVGNPTTRTWYYYSTTDLRFVVVSNETLSKARACVQSLTTDTPGDVCDAPLDFVTGAENTDFITTTTAGVAPFSYEFNVPVASLGTPSLLTGYSMNLYLEDLAGNVTVTNPDAFVGIFNINPGNDPVGFPTLGGTTTDWATIEDFTSVSNLTFEAVGLGKIVFTPGTLDLTSATTIAQLQNLGTEMQVTGGDATGTAVIGLNSAGAALSAFDVPAEITVTVPAGTQPGLVVYDNLGGIDGYIDNTGTPVVGLVPTDTISVSSWVGTDLTFSTSGFSFFGTDNTAPTVTTYSPADGAMSAGINSNLTLTFDENVRVGAGNIDLYRTSGNVLVQSMAVGGANVTFNGTTGVTINPTAALLNSTDYYVQIDAGAILDTVGNSYAGIADTTTWNFRTAGASSGGGSGAVASNFPTGSININAGAAYTNNLSVSVNVSYTNASEIMLSENSNMLNGYFQPISASVPFALSGGEGMKTIYAYLKNSSGVSDKLSDSIEFSLNATPAQIAPPVVPPVVTNGLVLTDPAPAAPLPPQLSVGMLVKVAGSPSVYFIDNDNRRHAFPNAMTYNSWFPDFSNVQTISSALMAQLPLGSNVTMRPVTYFVKIATDPKVYAVESYGVLRWIPDETTAIGLFGANWSSRVADVSDAFFTNYQVGTALTPIAHPTGSLIQYQGEANVYFIENGMKSYVSSSAFVGNHFQNKFKSADISSSIAYTSGPDMVVTPVETLMKLR